MKVYNYILVRKSLRAEIHSYKKDVRKNLLERYPTATKIKVTKVLKQADHQFKAPYWKLTAEGEV